MKTSSEILNELRQISPLLAEIEKTNVFSVPDGYFNTLTALVVDHINFPSILTKSGNTTFEVPSGYFDTLSENILVKIRSVNNSASEEIKELSPVLYSVQKENVFSAPPDYFDELPEKLAIKIHPQQATIIRMRKRSTAWQYARAAVMTGIIALSALLVYNNQSPYASAASEQPAGQYINEQQINEGISRLSDEEIIKYLETNGNSSDNETLTNSIDEKQLPEKSELLNDVQSRGNAKDPTK